MIKTIPSTRDAGSKRMGLVTHDQAKNHHVQTSSPFIANTRLGEEDWTGSLQQLHSLAKLAKDKNREPNQPGDKTTQRKCKALDCRI